MSSVVLLAGASASASAQAPVIASFGRNGVLVCTNLMPATTASVQCASAVLGPWTNTCANLEAVPVDPNGAMRVSVPMFSDASMFYRVRGFSAPSNMAWIPPGTFTMGSPDSEPARYLDEGPQTSVTITRGFYMGRFEVTQGEYLAVMGSNPSYFTTQDGYGNPIPPDLSRPVEQMSWNDAVAYCATLTARERNASLLPAGYSYRLPTEAEWEYACRGGTTTPFQYGNALRSGMANFSGSSEYPPCGSPEEPPCYGDCCYNPSGISLVRTTTVGSYAPNAWGLYDMVGNVWEWCHDWYGSYPAGSILDPQGPQTGSVRVIRGGSWGNQGLDCRSAVRSSGLPTYAQYDIGLRVVLASGPP